MFLGLNFKFFASLGLSKLSLDCLIVLSEWECYDRLIPSRRIKQRPILMMIHLIVTDIMIEGGYYLFNRIVRKSSFQKRQSNLSFLNDKSNYLRCKFDTNNILFLKLITLLIVFINHFFIYYINNNNQSISLIII